MIIGIDPGFTGAIAFLYLKGNHLICKDLPIHKFMYRNEVNGKALTKLIKRFSEQGNIKCVAIEDVHPMPGQGIVSTSRFLYNAGILLGICNALDLDVLKVKPVVWKSALNLSSDKAKSLTLAKKLFPSYKHYFQRAKDDGRAEAALIAYYARKCLY